MTDIIIGTVTLDNVVDYDNSAPSRLRQREATRRSEPYWYPHDHIRTPVQYSLTARGNNTLVDDLQALFRLHTWQGFDDDGDGEDEWDVLITEIEVNYRTGFVNADAQWEIDIHFYRRPASDLFLWLKQDYGVGSIAFDSSKNKFHGDISGASWNTSGKRGNCLSFDGANDYIDLGTNALFNPSTATLMGWVYIDPADDGEDFGRVIQLGGSSGLQIRWRTASNIFEGIAVLNVGGTKTLTSSAIGSAGWYHVALTVSATQALLYVDSSIEDTENYSSDTINYNDTTAYVGGDTTSTNIKARLDEIKGWSRVLAQAEITEEYNRWA